MIMQLNLVYYFILNKSIFNNLINKVYIYSVFIFDFNFEIIVSSWFSDIWLFLKLNNSNLLNLTFSNTFISDILLNKFFN